MGMWEVMLQSKRNETARSSIDQGSVTVGSRCTFLAGDGLVAAAGY